MRALKSETLYALAFAALLALPLAGCGKANTKDSSTAPSGTPPADSAPTDAAPSGDAKPEAPAPGKAPEKSASHGDGSGGS
jgi:hypothetical protein